MGDQASDQAGRGLFAELAGDGRFPLLLTGTALVGSGFFALFLSVTGHFLPHDVAHLGFDAAQLACAGNEQLVNFMFHDRVAFGGSLIAVGLLYLWLTAFPLRQGEAWAWWTLLCSGVVGFGSFLSYLGYGYLDTWHGVATLALLPVFVSGMWPSWRTLKGEKRWFVVLRPPVPGSVGRRAKIGRMLLLFYGAGLIAAGATISIVGMTSVFVSTDLEYIGLSYLEICGVSDRLVPVIAHDRAGFGGGLLTIGVMLVIIVRHAAVTRSYLQVMFLSGCAGFGTAIGVHFVVGYVDTLHLAPAFAGAAIFLAGLALIWAGSRKRTAKSG